LIFGLEDVWVGLFADFALEFFPVATGNVLTQIFTNLLSLDPALQTLEVNKSNGTFALASKNQRILNALFITPAESAVLLFIGSDRKMI
jgi:hypothetical protein